MRQSLRLAAALVMAWGTLAGAANPRVALVSGDLSDSAAKLVALAQVKLAAERDLELLERDQIRQVMDEQKLTTLGIVDANLAISLGKLLKADLFAVVEGASGADVGSSIVVFDAATGVRYWDTELSVGAAELEKTADAIILAVLAANRKRARQSQGLRTVGFVTVRNADLPRTQDGLCDTVGFFVERGLPRSPDLAVLERRRLERVNLERALPGADQPNALLASLTTVDLEISRGDGGRGLRATALVRHAGALHAEKVTASVPDVNAAALAEALLEELIEFFKAAPAAAPTGRLVEARRFDREAAHHFKHQRYTDAVRASEAAFALDPTNEFYIEQLSYHLVYYATFLVTPKEMGMSKGGDRAWMDVRLEPAVVESLLAATDRAVEISLLAKRNSSHYLRFNQALGQLCDRLRGLQKAAMPPVRQQLDETLELCRRRSLRYCDEEADKAAADPNWLDRYTTSLDFEIKVLKSASIDTAQYGDCLFRILSRWVSVTKQWQPRHNTSDGGELFNMLMNHSVKPTNWPWPADDVEFARKMAPLYSAMQQHARPLVRLYGLYGEIRSDILLEKTTAAAGYSRYASEYRKLVQSIITTPEPWNPQRTRFAAYEAWHSSITDMPGNESREFSTRELLELCDFMAGRHEMVYKAVQKAFGQLDRPASLKLIEQLMPVVESPLFKENTSERTRLKSFLKTTEQNILGAQPNLANTPLTLPWNKATRLFELTEHRELGELVGCLPIDKSAYGFCLQFDGDRAWLRMIRIPLEGGRIELLAKADLAMSAVALAPHRRLRFVTSICADQGTLYVATDGAGIAVFPLKGGIPRRIDVADGLPSSNVISMAVLNGKLYAGYADGYLVAYDLQGHQCEILASSRRKQKLSPFDDSAPFRVPTLVADPARRRVVFVIGRNLWQLTPSDGTFKKLLELVDASPGSSGPKLDGSVIDRSSPLRGDRVLVSNVFRVMELDLKADKAIEIHAPEYGIFQTAPPHVIVSGSLWSGGSFSRLSLDKRSFQALPAPDKGPNPFRPTICLELVAEGRQLVAADLQSVWLLNLAETQTAPNTVATSSPMPTASSPAPKVPEAGKPSAPLPNCTVRVQITTEDGLPIGDDECLCHIHSGRERMEGPGEIRFKFSSGNKVRPEGGLISTQMHAGMISLGITAAGYAPAVIEYREGKPNEILDLGTITLKRGFTWKLVVRNDLDQPVPDAEVTAVCRFHDTGATVATDSKGMAELPRAAAEEYTLTLRAPGHQVKLRERVRADAEKTERIEMERARSTTGQLLTQDGQPVADAKIILLGNAQDVLPEGRILSTTDATGRFVLDQLTDNVTHRIRVDVNNKPRLALPNVVAGQANVRWKLLPAISLAGSVKGIGDKESRRLAFQQCVADEFGRASASFFGGEIRLDGDARFVINDLIPGVIRLDGFGRSVEIDLAKTRDDYVLDLSLPIAPRVPAPMAAEPRTTDPRGKCSVRAVVVNEAGTPVQGTYRLSSSDTANGSGSGQGGGFSAGIVAAQVEPGLISLGISAAGYAPAAIGPKRGQRNEVLDFGTVTLITGFTWNINIIDDEKKPVSHAELAAVCRFGQNPTRLTSSAAGSVQVPHAAEDEYTFSVRAAGCQPQSGIKLKAEVGKEATITVRRSHPSSGTIFDHADKPVAGAKILLIRDVFDSFDRNPKELTTTDAQGKFVLDQLADGRLCVVRVDVDGKLRLVVTNVEAGKTDVVWKLQPSLSLAGRVVGFDAGAERRLMFDQRCADHLGNYSGSFHNGAVRVEDDGSFRIDGLIAGQIRLAGFRRSADVDLPQTRDDYVLDLNTLDPTKPNSTLRLEFVQDGKPIALSGQLSGQVTQRTERRYSSLSLPLEKQTFAEIKAFVPGALILKPDGIVGTSYCLGTQNFELKAGQASVFVDLIPAGSISGVVRDGTGQPVADAIVTGRSEAGGSVLSTPQVRSNDNGEFTLVQVPLDRPIVVTAFSGGAVSNSTPVTLRAGVPADKLNLRLGK